MTVIGLSITSMELGITRVRISTARDRYTLLTHGLSPWFEPGRGDDHFAILFVEFGAILMQLWPFYMKVEFRWFHTSCGEVCDAKNFSNLKDYLLLRSSLRALRNGAENGTVGSLLSPLEVMILSLRDRSRDVRSGYQMSLISTPSPMSDYVERSMSGSNWCSHLNNLLTKLRHVR